MRQRFVSPPLAPASATGASPHVRDGRNLRTMDGVVLTALLPCVLVGARSTGMHGAGGPDAALPAFGRGLLGLLPILLTALLTAVVWEEVFARARKRRRETGTLLIAVLFSLLMPAGAPLWQVALGMSVGVVLGCHVFGGPGLGFVQPAVLGSVFLFLTYPDSLAAGTAPEGLAGYGGTRLFKDLAAAGMEALPAQGITWMDAFLGRVPGLLGVPSALACALGGLYLLWCGVIDWRTPAAVVIGVIAATLLLQGSDVTSSPMRALSWTWHLVLGSLAFGTVFLATDPMTAPITRGGRWLHGLGVGFVVVLIRTTNPLHPDGTLLAILLGNVFAPALDALVVHGHGKRRERRRAR